MTNDPAAVADVCDKAADLIQFTGWTQHTGAARDRDGNVIGYCTVGAIAATRPAVITYDAYELEWEAKEAVHTFLGLSPEVSIPAWNDSPSRVAADAIDALRGTAKALREQVAL
jgi:hypothetical protein